MICPVLFGVDSIECLPDEIKKMGAASAFVVYDQGVKATGIGDRVMKILADGGIMPVEPSTFVKEIPPELVNSRRAYSGYDGGFGGGEGRDHSGRGELQSHA